MSTNVERYRADLQRLSDKGILLLQALQAEHIPDAFDAAAKKQKMNPSALRKVLGNFVDQYQAWYSEAKALIRQLLPDRLDDFVRHYEKPKSRKAISFENYRIEDCLQGLTTTRGYDGKVLASPSSAIPHFKQQVEIIRAVQSRFESSLFDIRQLVQADLFDSELDVARELAKKGFLRAAGAVAGVIIEKHLAQVAANHKVVTKKKHPTISDFNDLLKNASAIDVPEWRRIQRLGDLRNLCDHNKHRDPTKEEIEELVEGTAKLMKSVF